MQSIDSGDVVYTSKSSFKNGVSNLRNKPDTVNSTVIGSVEPYSQVKIISGPYESEKLANFFSFYKVSVNGKEGYMSTSIFSDTTTTATVPHVTFPTNHGQAVGRVYIKDDVPYLKDNKDGTFSIVRAFKEGEMIRLKGVKGDYYDVGGEHYIKRFDPNMVVIIARANTRKTSNGNIKLYTLKGGKLTEQGTTYTPGHNLRVYDYDDKYVYVGGSEQSGWQIVKNDSSILLYKGFVKAKKPTNMYAPDGSVHRMIQPGEQARVYNIDGDRFDVGNGYYIKIDKNFVEYSPH
jgi:hypothetical protein